MNVITKPPKISVTTGPLPDSLDGPPQRDNIRGVPRGVPLGG